MPQPASVALTVLTDYEQIPRFMPDVRTSPVIERGDDYAVVEQEAVAKFMLFSKRIHLVLEVQEHAGTIRFRDRCGKSFKRYEGAWTVSDHRRSHHHWLPPHRETGVRCSGFSAEAAAETRCPADDCVSFRPRSPAAPRLARTESRLHGRESTSAGQRPAVGSRTTIVVPPPGGQWMIS